MAGCASLHERSFGKALDGPVDEPADVMAIEAAA
jgi:hypothetical protein